MDPPPFEPRHEDDRVYARGAGDDKGQLFMHLKVVEAWMAAAGRLPVNLRFFFEGDEEVGSEPVEAFIAEHPRPARGRRLRRERRRHVRRRRHPRHRLRPARDRLLGDAHPRPAPGRALGPYGGGIDNPANVLVRMLASLTDAEGRVAVPGFYDRVRELTDDERAAYAALPFDEAGAPRPASAPRWR